MSNLLYADFFSFYILRAMEYVPVVMQFSNTKMCGSMKEQIKKEGGGSLEN